MPRLAGEDKPGLLMLSDVVPDPRGPLSRARAWQLLRQHAVQHDVHLICLCDGPVRLTQWRVIQSHTTEAVIEKPPVPRRIASRLSGAVTQAAHLQRVAELTLAPLAEQWHADRRFDAALCTRPELWPVVRSLTIPDRTVDILQPIPDRRATLKATAMRLQRQALCEADLALAADARAADLLGESDCPVDVRPIRLDTTRFDAIASPPADDPSAILAVHADPADRAFARSLRRFRFTVWPRIRRAARHARLQSPRRRQRCVPTDHLCRATAVAIVGVDEQAAQFAALQAMAMGRPVIVAAPIARALGAEDGHELLATDAVSDLSERCVTVLRSTELQQRLGAAARAFIERRFDLLARTAPLDAAAHPTAGLVAPTPTARAA